MSKHHFILQPFVKMVRWYYKQSKKAVEATFREYLGFGILYALFATIIVNMWNSPTAITTRASSMQNIASQYGFANLGLGIFTFLVWFMLLSFGFLTITFSWIIYKLVFRTKLRKYMNRLRNEAKSAKRSNRSHR